MTGVQTCALPIYLVSGHVDGVGEIVSRSIAGRSEQFKIKAPDELAKYIAKKGSICVEGSSLTVNQVNCAVVELNIVPHTAEQTTLAKIQAGDQVHLEVDIIARYLEQLLSNKDNAVVISSDLSHFHNLKEAKRLDKNWLRGVEELDLAELEKGCLSVQ